MELDKGKATNNELAQAGLITPKLPRIFYGGDYNPEQWPEEIWLEDMRLMQEAGVNLVSLGIFSWARLEPIPGQFDFDWLDRLMDLLDKHGIKVDLATATASPPPWLARLHPESLPVTATGVTLWPGARQQYCPSSPAYRDGIQTLVHQLATRYQNHPALAMWHIGNEYGCHVTECYCDVSAQDFRQWLQKRYGTLEALNAAWGTNFWSQHYSRWDEIYPPRRMPTFANPTQQLDFKRFSSDALLECFLLEANILRKFTPTVPITTNFMGFFKPLDYWKWAAYEDVISNDSYPDPVDSQSWLDAAASYDLMRSLGGGKAWVLMEQTTSQVNWRAENAIKRPGQMRLGSYQALARGANGIMFFQWRASQAGAEKFHGAMVPHVGTEDSRVWREVKKLGAELGGLDQLLNTQVKAKVAIVFDWESWWSLELDSKPSTDIKLLEQLRSYYKPLYQHNVTVDFVPPYADLSAYQVVLVPNLYLVRDNDEVAQKLEQFVEKGGVLVMSFFSGIANQDDHILLGGYPAPFRKVLGLRVEEFDPYVKGHTNRIELPSNNSSSSASSYQSELWSDVIDLEGAEAIATYVEDFYKGKAAITRHQFGQGLAYYLGTRPEPAFMEWLLIEKVCREARINQPAFNVPSGVEMVTRSNDKNTYTFVLNHNKEKVEFKLDQPTQNLLSDTRQPFELVKLEPYGVAILVANS